MESLLGEFRTIWSPGQKRADHQFELGASDDDRAVIG